MNRNNAKEGRKLLVELGKYAAIPIDEIDDDDALLLRDFALEYVKVVSKLLACGRSVVDAVHIEDAKAAFHTITRMKLKYMLMRVDSVWELYRRYDSIIEPYFKVAKYSAAHDFARKTLNSSRSYDKIEKIEHYDEFVKPIQNMTEFLTEYEGTKVDCRAKIRDADANNRLIKRLGSLMIPIVSLLIPIFVCTSIESIKKSVVGKFVSKCIALYVGRADSEYKSVNKAEDMP